MKLMEVFQLGAKKLVFTQNTWNAWHKLVRQAQDGQPMDPKPNTREIYSVYSEPEYEGGRETFQFSIATNKNNSVFLYDPNGHPSTTPLRMTMDQMNNWLHSNGII